MPPVQKKPVEKEPFLKPGKIINLDTGGRTLTGLEVIDYDDKFLKLRWNMQISPQTEMVLIPWEKVGIVGLTDER